MLKSKTFEKSQYQDYTLHKSGSMSKSISHVCHSVNINLTNWNCMAVLYSSEKFNTQLYH